MNIRRKLVFRFIGQLLVAGGILIALALGILVWVADELNQIEAERDFGAAGLQRLSETMTVEDGVVSFDSVLLEQVKDYGGWLQALDEQGKVIAGYHVPEDVPSSYGVGELNAYWHGQEPFPYHLYLWIQEVDGKLRTLVYGEPKVEEEWLKRIAAQGVNGHILDIPADIAEQLQNMGGWVQLVDEQGGELASYHKPEAAIDEFSPQELALRLTYPTRYNTQMIAYHEFELGRTWLLSLPLDSQGARGASPILAPEVKVLLTGLLMLLASALVVFSLLSIWYARGFGAPLLHAMEWIRGLEAGEYKEPTGKSGLPRSMTKRGKPRYQLFQELIRSLSALSQSLHISETERARTMKTREEWIEGVSHDMKTPLSSIQGYAHLLAADQYEWTADEIKEFGQVMLQKSIYMDNLINDLSLTYRLKHDGTPPSEERVELNGCLAEMVERTHSHPRFKEEQIIYKPSGEEVQVFIYLPWLQRIVDNLIANAILHNPEGTKVDVRVQKDSDRHVMVVFEDNGKGMDEATAAMLFERYYKGTSTDAALEGSGLGMAVTKALVEAMGGSIRVDTVLGLGTRIEVTLPIG